MKEGVMTKLPLTAGRYDRLKDIELLRAEHEAQAAKIREFRSVLVDVLTAIEPYPILDPALFRRCKAAMAPLVS